MYKFMYGKMSKKQLIEIIECRNKQFDETVHSKVASIHAADEEELRIKTQIIADLQEENRQLKKSYDLQAEEQSESWKDMGEIVEAKTLAEAKVKVLEKALMDTIGTLHYMLGNSFSDSLIKLGILIKKEDEIKHGTGN